MSIYGTYLMENIINEVTKNVKLSDKEQRFIEEKLNEIYSDNLKKYIKNHHLKCQS